ncbi:unnamed protein product [Acanthoscelides obtectus]|uniref:Cytochrome P450 n=1 Tax=Acanthoscelides obtectus TaxID=200917 RepID=A0A9P0LFP2_ACAOB|nr:unnamed protein product [Acanthoscelides obtectus]CAK1649125.1 Cytochrome P450 307a1 [Acanthoscelides obtectus]
MLSLFLSLSLTNTLLVLTIILLMKVIFELFAKDQTKTSKKEDGLLEPPMPRKWPIIGHLHLMGGYEVPYQAFSAIGRKYGDLVNIQLGNVKCVVVNGQKNIREALVTKGHHFDSRPNFQRYHMLFSGNKENSLAFCDWSDTQKTRRDMLKIHTFPRAFTNKFYSLEQLMATEMQSMMSQVKSNHVTDLKPIILRHCANIFLNHFCSKNFNANDRKFVEMVDNFDDIFYEVNQGHAADFLPFLMPLHKKNLERIQLICQNIRQFFDNEVIENRYEDFDIESEPNDYVESLICSVKSGASPDLSWDSAMFALEDIIGGHSAVGNFLVKVFAYLVKEPEVQKKMQEEIDRVVGGNRSVSLTDKNAMPYTEAVIFEAIRLIASPIVPRVANQDSSIDDYRIEKGTVLFLNNYDLSMSEKLWDEPKKFMPERFIRDNRLIKPDYFLPFGGGRRSCMGYRMVQLVSFGILGEFLQNFTVCPVENESYKVPVGSLALKKDTFKFRFVRRQ